MAVKLADAFVQITARSEGLQKDVAKQLAGLGKVGEQVGKDAGDKFAKEFDAETKDIDGTVKKSLGGLDKFAASTGQSMGSKISSGINKTLKAGVIGVGVAAGGVLAASITKGLGRLQGIDNAQAKLAGLGHEAKAVEGIMDDALASVKGTAFGLEDAATIAASSVAAGIKPGEDLQRTLKLTGDAATIAGTDLSTMGSIINKVATSDMMQMDVANQMMDAGIPILQMVGEELGVTAEEARKMASDGEVSFETFQSALENGLGGAALKSGDTVQGAFANMQAAAGRFGAKLAEPIFKAAPAVFGSLGGAFDTLGEKLEPLIEDFAEWLAPRMEAFATETIPKLVDGVMGAVDSFIEFGGWVKDNAEWIKPLAAGIGGAVAAIYAWNTATTIAKGIQIAFNAVMAVNPIMLIVVALAAVTAGLIYFFTQTETGREMWSKFTTALGAGWDWVTEKLSAGWAWIQENVFNAFGRKMDELSIWWKNTTGRLKAAWQDVQMVFSAVWEAIKTAVFDAWNWYVDQVKSNWEMVTSALNSAWTFVKDTFTSVWNAIKTAVFDAWNAYVNQVKANWDTVTNALNKAWTALKDHFSSIWNTIKTSVLDAWNTAVNFLRDTFNTITTTISDKWTWLKDQMSNVWSWIRDNVFSKFNSAIDLMRSGAEIAMDGIGKAFDWLREKTAKPVNFVIETVYMGGIRKAWGAVASLVGLEELPEVKSIGGYAQGTARIPGPRTPYDNVHMVSQDGRFGISLRGGEGVLVPEAVDGLGEGAVNALNHAGIHGGKPAVDRVLNALGLGGFARGGFIDLGGFNLGGVTNLAGNLSAIQRSHAQFVGRFFPDLFNLTSAGRQEPGSFHDFGSMAATDWQAKDGQYATQMPTAGSKALARAIFTNFPNSAELIHHPLDGWQNINDGAPHNYGAGTNAGHRNHVHWATRSPLQFDGDNIVLTDAGGGGIFETITNMAKRLWDGVVDKIPGFPGADTLGKFGQLPAAFLKKAASSAWEFIKSKADAMMPFGGSAGGGAEQWRGLASQALKRMGYGDEYLDAMVQQIQIESTGDPNAVNNWDSNALRGTPSRGLLQVIDPTYRDVRNRYPEAFEGLPDDPTHPLTNLVAGVGAVKRDWGGPGGRWPTKDGYHDGGLAPAGQGLMHKTALEPEMVLSPKMTKAFIDWMKVPDGESVRVMSRELAEAFNGGDWGMGELASYIGIELAESIINGAAALGEISRTIGEQAQKSGTDYATTQATGALDVMGLGGLVPLGQKLGAKAWDLYQASPYEVGFNGQSVTVEIEAESDADLIRVSEFKRLADQVRGLDVKVNQRPSAASITRGGVM